MIALNLSNPLHNLDQPEGLDDIEPFCTYTENYKNVVIHNVNKDPREFDTSKPCLICNKAGHAFDDCPILNNVSHLKKHYISWKMFLAKAARQQDKMLHNNHINQPTTF